MWHDEEGHHRGLDLPHGQPLTQQHDDMIYYIQCSCLRAAQSSHTHKSKNKNNHTTQNVLRLQFCVGPHSQLSLTIRHSLWLMGWTYLHILLQSVVHSARNIRKISQSGKNLVLSYSPRRTWEEKCAIGMCLTVVSCNGEQRRG